MPIINHATRAEWLQARKGYITASDAAIICSEIPTPYKDPVTLWAEALGFVEPAPPSDVMKAGIIKEPHIAEIYTELEGIELYNHGDFAIHVHPDIPWLSATLDRVETESRKPVEIKNVGEFNKDYWEKGAAPLPFECQLQIQMFVTGAKEGILYSEIGGNRWVKREYKVNDKFINGLLPQLEAFHKSKVDEVEPEYDFWSQAITKTFVALHPNDNGETVYFDTGIANKAEEWAAMNVERLDWERKARAIKKMQDPLSIAIMGAIGDNTYGDTGSVRFALKTRADKKRQLKIVE